MPLQKIENQKVSSAKFITTLLILTTLDIELRKIQSEEPSSPQPEVPAKKTISPRKPASVFATQKQLPSKKSGKEFQPKSTVNHGPKYGR